MTDFSNMTDMFRVVTDGCGNVYVLDGDTGYPLAGPVEVGYNQDNDQSESDAANRAVREAMEQAMERAEYVI